jgi:hypothetical protein
MIERLRRALEHIEELSPATQEAIAQQVEEMTEPIDEIGEEEQTATVVRDHRNLPKSVRDALAVAGIARDLQYDDEFEALDRIRHESQPTPPIDLDDL